MGYAFISYSSKNQSSADALRDLLNSNGVETWMAPGDIPAGSSYMKEINQALKNCSCLVLLLSNASQGSQWVIREVERVINYRKTVVPVQIEDVILNDEFEFVLGPCKVVAVQKIDPNSIETKKVLNRIMAITGVRPADSSCDAENRAFYNEQRLAEDEGRIISAGDVAAFGDDQFLFHIGVPTADIPHVEKPGREESGMNMGIGSTIDGTYTIIANLGSGAFTKVYLAENQRTKKKWAIKEIKISHDKYRSFSERLSNEINIVNRLQHPCLPSIADIIQTRDSLLVVMDYIEGVSLSKIIHEKGAQREETVVDWSKKICDALQYLHSRTPPIIHNDIHPKNIMLKPNGDISLIDFGTAMESTLEPDPDTVVLGTTFYTAPERFRGIMDARTDIYSFGMTVYALVSGKDPSAPPYTVCPLRKINPNLSLGLEYIVNKCIARNPLERYQNASEVLDDLEGIDRLTKTLEKKNRIGKLFSKKG